MIIGIIKKALSGFYYVDIGSETITCRARGKFRHQHESPLVGDQVEITVVEPGVGMVDVILPRRNEFARPSVSNIDQLVVIASGAIPVTDPFLIDRVVSIAEGKNCEPILCFNKCDLNRAEALVAMYQATGITTLQISADTGEGIDQLRALITDKVSAFTGNSGVGKSSILNALEPTFSIQVGEVSNKLGRGRHTTRHVELHRLGCGALVADTPGFSSFDTDKQERRRKESLADTFREFRPYLEECQFVGCSHTKEKGCAVLAALADKSISTIRHESYCRLYEQAKVHKDWEFK